jgi:hypothetical protein
MSFFLVIDPISFHLARDIEFCRSAMQPSMSASELAAFADISSERRQTFAFAATGQIRRLS